MNPTLPPVLGSQEAEPHAPAPTRRNLLFKAGVALNAIGALLLGLPLIGFVFSSFFHKHLGNSWISLGTLDKFPVNETRLTIFRNPFTRPWDGETADIPCYVRQLPDQKFKVFAVNCAHLGCPVRWFEESGLFMCPCHGGVYYSDGSRASGPPPRGLFEYHYKVENGELFVKGGEMPTLRSIALWIDDRLHLTKLFESTAGHHVPASAGSWFYVFGSATLLCFVIQIITGTCLAFVYVPSTNEAWTSLQYLNQEQYLGWLLRAIHYWGSNFMVAIMTLHMIQVFLFGAYKYPREMTWISGIFLMLLTLGMAFTGQVLRWDSDAYWGLGIGASIMGRLPLVGGNMVHLMLGGPIIAGETLSRFFTLHVFMIPGFIIALVSIHLRLVLSKGINEYPTPGKPIS